MNPTEPGTTDGLPAIPGLTKRGWSLGRAYALLRMLLDARAESVRQITPDAISDLKHFAGILLGMRDEILALEESKAVQAAFSGAFTDVQDVGVSEVDSDALKNGKLILVMRLEMNVEDARLPLHEEQWGLRDSTKEGANLVLKRIRQALTSKIAGGTVVDSVLRTYPVTKTRGLSLVPGIESGET